MAKRRCRLAAKKTSRSRSRSTQKALGLDLATLSKDLRSRYKIKDSVKGVVITGVEAVPTPPKNGSAPAT